ncbi:MAG TPA: SDR family oxidoreductase [bacterium]|nr:SDR family oxidoreductase [bacterium]
MTPLSGKVAVITGATSGIGEAAARRLGESGVRLVITGRDEDLLSDLSRETGAEWIADDITDPGLPQRLLEKALQVYQRCDILVNNAGQIVRGRVEDIDIGRVCQMVRVNVEAVFRAAYTFLRHFREQNAGDLVNISSVMGEKVRETIGAYAGTKWAVEALSESLRMELSRTDVRVTCIQPGLVTTRLHRDWEVHPSDMMVIPVPLTPDDIAAQIIHVLGQPSHVRIPKLMILPGGHVI